MGKGYKGLWEEEKASSIENYKKSATHKAIIKREATRGKRRYECTRRILAYRNDRKYLKRITKKRIMAAFRKRISAKAAIFSVFKSVSLVSKSDDTKT